jgi:hypothetical protein
MRSTRYVIVVLVLMGGFALAACSSSTKSASPSSSSSALGASNVAGKASGSGATDGSTSPPKSGESATLPANHCLFTDEEASKFAGGPVKGNATSMGGNDSFCTFNTTNGDAGISVSIKHYEDPSKARFLVDSLFSSQAHSLYAQTKRLDIGDGGGVGCSAQGKFCIVRFVVDHTFVGITLRPSTLDTAGKAGQAAAAKF